MGKVAWELLYTLSIETHVFNIYARKEEKMRKLIVLIFIIGFVGSAGAAEVTYHFTAEFQLDLNGEKIFSDGAEIFSEMGYSKDMELKGTITYDPEIQGVTYSPVPDAPDAAALPNAWGFWTTGVIVFENQRYSWLDNCNRYIKIQNSSTDHTIKISTKQGNPTNPDDPEMMQVITATIDGLDASMPSDLDLGDSAQYIVQFTKSPGKFSFFKANITIIPAEEYNNSADQSVEIEGCPSDNEWKNHGAYVRCVARSAGEKSIKDGLISGKEKSAIVSRAAKSEYGKKK